MERNTDLTLKDLAEASRVPQRTIRYYISRGLLSGPVQRGRHAHYNQEHLLRLQAIQAQKDKGRSLAEMAGERTEMPTAPLRLMRQFTLAEDVVLYVADDASPWRKKLVFEAATRLSITLKSQKHTPQETEHRDE